MRLGAVEETKFKSKDGTEIHGFLAKPPDYAAGKRYPTLLRIHGGPIGQYECSFDVEWQMFAANGYVVVAANSRGSSGRGRVSAGDLRGLGQRRRPTTSSPRRRRGGAGHRRSGPARRRRLELRRHPDRLRIATTRVQGGDQRRRIATSRRYGDDQYVREYDHELGTPWKNIDVWLKVSFPFFHADRITTPTLFLCGEDDFNVPLAALRADVPGAAEPRRSDASL